MQRCFDVMFYKLIIVDKTCVTYNVVVEIHVVMYVRLHETRN